MPISQETRDTGARLIARYPVARSALLPLLHLVQSEEGYVTEDGIAYCADAVGLSKAEVGAVATFYTMFRRRDPGDYLLSVCTNPTCNTGGAQQILQRYKQRLGGDRNVELGCEVESAECLGICDAAPMVQVNYEMYGPLTIDEADALLELCIAKDPPPSHWSGDVPPTFREFEADIAGVNDGLDDILAASARHQASYENPPTYRTGETDLPITQPGGDPTGIGGVIAGEQGVPSLFDAALAASELMANGSAGNGSSDDRVAAARTSIGGPTRGAATAGAAHASGDAGGARGSGTTGTTDDVGPAEASSSEPDTAEGSATEGGAPPDSVAAERAEPQPGDQPDDDAPDDPGVGAAADRTSPEGDADADAGAETDADEEA